MGLVTNIVWAPDMRVGEIRQFCKLQDEGQSLMRATMPQLNLPARAYHRTQSVKLAGTTADLAEALHASQPAEVDDGSGITQYHSSK